MSKDPKSKPTSALSQLAMERAPAPVWPLGQTMVCRRALKGHFGKIYAMHWGSDSTRLVSASQDGKLIIWNGFTTNKEHAIALRSSWVMTCAFSPELKMVAAGGLDNICSIYKVPAERKGMTNDKPQYELAQHEGYLSCCRFLSEEQILTSSGDGTAILWDIEKRLAVSVFTEHTSDVMSVCINEANPNLFVSGSCDATAKVWDIRRPPKQSVLTYQEHESDINSVHFMAEGTAFATGSDDSHCKLFDLRSQKAVQDFSDRKQNLGSTCVSFSRTGRLLFASFDEGDIVVFDTLTGKVIDVREFSGHNKHDERVSCVSVSPDGQALCSASWDTFLRIWA
jgi:guanine nucleotide-binding protein G(I)/G(S)/G(T) subunit beta-1